jgi:hypothetical protein
LCKTHINSWKEEKQGKIRNKVLYIGGTPCNPKAGLPQTRKPEEIKSNTSLTKDEAVLYIKNASCIPLPHNSAPTEALQRLPQHFLLVKNSPDLQRYTTA